MEQEAIQKAAELAAEIVSSAQNTPPLGIWDYLNIHRWIPELIAIATAGCAGIVVIWRCAVFFVKANNAHRELKKSIKAYEKEKEEHDVCRQKLADANSILIDGSFLFVKHDPAPQFPVCPVCYADGKIIRMLRVQGDE